MRKSASATFNITWNKDLKEGDSIEGYYVDTKVVSGQFGENTKYTIETKDGTLYDIFASASLSSQFKNVPEGCYVWITYDGEVKSKNGRTVKQYTVDYDDEIVK